MKKAIAMLLTAAMSVTLLAGCGGDDGSSTPSSGGAPTGAQDSKESTPADDGQGGNKTLADYEKETNLRVFVINSGITDEEFNNQDIAKLIGEKTGYNVSYVQAPAADPQAKNNIFMLKEDYQIVNVTKDEFYVLMMQGALAPITEYVEASTNLKGAMTDLVWDSARGSDGEIYGIPYCQPKNVTANGLAYRVDWLNDYNAENPDAQIPVPSEENGYSMCISDFQKMLEYFKGKVASGGYPMAVRNTSALINPILAAFDVYQEWVDIDGKLTYFVEQPGFEEYGKFIDNLYDTDLLYYAKTPQDTNDITMMQDGRAGVCLANHWEALNIEKVSAPEGADINAYTDDNFGYMAALVPDEYKGDASAVRVFSSQYVDQYGVIPVHNTAQQVAGAVDFVDKKLDKDLFLELSIGVEGDTFEIRDGEYYLILGAEHFDKMTYADKFLNGTIMEDYSKYWLARARKSQAQEKIFFTINYNIDNTGIKSPVTMMPPNDVYNEYWSKVNSELNATLILNLFDKATTYDQSAVIATWERFNGPDVAEAVNEWYATWSSKDDFNTVKPR